MHFEQLGSMNLEADKPMEADTIFRIMSMTKPITSVAGMILYEDGRLQLADPVSKYIPEFKGLKVFADIDREQMFVADVQRDMTVRDLLMHTSGLTYGLPYALPIPGAQYYTKGYGFGLGLAVLTSPSQAELVGSEGEFKWAGAANTYFWVDPKEEIVGVLMAQFLPADYYPVSQQFKKLTYDAIIDRPAAAPPES